MKKRSICMAVLLMSACASEEIPVPDERPGYAYSDELTIRISFSENHSATRALTADDEKKITSLRIFVFKEAGASGITRDDILTGMIDVHQDSIKGVETDRRVIIGLKKPATGDPDQRFVLVANMHNTPNIIPSLANLVVGSSTEEDLINLLRFPATAKWGTALSENDPSKYIPMWGTSSFYDPEALVTASPISVNMTRALAGIEMGIDINNPAAGDPAVGFGHVFVIDSVYVCNVNDSAYIAPADWRKNISSKKTDIGYAFPANGLKLERSIYVPSTDSLIIESGDTTHLPPFLVLKARYYGGAPYYYRIDFTRNNSYIPLLRDNKYVINITGIRTTGYETLAEARNAHVLPLNPNLIIDGTDPATKTINDIIYLDNYWLGCQSTDVRMDWNCKDAEIPVATSYPGGWTAKFVGATPAGYQCISYPATNKVIIIAPDNNTGTTRRATIELSAGTLKQYIHLTQSPGSNTYVVQKGGLVIIPKSSANMDGVDRAIDMVSANWRFINSTQTTNAINGQGTFDFVAPNQEGVLIVEARSAAGAVYTWTVWVVENAVDFESPSYWRHHNGYTFMDRDLGNSIRYQWGRKDPDVVADRHISPAPQNMDEQGVAAILYTFITGDTFPYDWMTAGQKNNLWTTIDGEKAPYDPCPFGWRVPPAENNEASPLNGFTNGKNGMTIPNTGGLSGTDGVTAIPGSLIWGASARGADAYLYDAAAGSHKSAHRTDAYPVRCIRDVKYPGGSLVAK